jgi:hypothetical protein
MLSSVLRSKRAVQVNVAIMRTFVQLREMLTSNEALRRKIEEMEKRYDARFRIVFAAIKEMLDAPKKEQTPHWFSRLARSREWILPDFVWSPYLSDLARLTSMPRGEFP